MLKNDVLTTTLIKKIEDSLLKIEHLYQNVPPSALAEPALPTGWSVKDTVGHLAAWVWRFVAILDAARETNTPLYARPDIENLNRAYYQERRTWPWLTIEADFCQAHSALMGLIRDFSPERLADPLVQEAIARETWQHHAAHLPDLEGWYAQLELDIERTSKPSIPLLFAEEASER